MTEEAVKPNESGYLADKSMDQGGLGKKRETPLMQIDEGNKPFREDIPMSMGTKRVAAPGKKLVRKIKTKSYLDAHGYMVSADYSSYDEVEDTVKPTVAKKMPQTQAPKVKTVQKGLSAFFKQK